MRRQGLEQVLDHCPQTPHNLQVVGTAGADLAECEMQKIFPIGCPENQAQLPGWVQYFIGAQVTLTDRPQHPIELIDREYTGRRIVDRRR